jgi:hypothetical protein
MPAFSNFMRLHVAESSTVRSLRSRFRSTQDSSVSRSPGTMASPMVLNGTFGSPPPRKKPPRNYYGMTDTTELRTQCTVHDGEAGPATSEANQAEKGILRRVDIEQQSRHDMNTHYTDGIF